MKIQDIWRRILWRMNRAEQLYRIAPYRDQYLTIIEHSQIQPNGFSIRVTVTLCDGTEVFYGSYDSLTSSWLVHTYRPGKWERHVSDTVLPEVWKLKAKQRKEAQQRERVQHTRYNDSAIFESKDS